MVGLSSVQITLIGFFFLLIMTVVSAIGNYVGSRVGTGKDLDSHNTRLNKHSERMDKIEDDIDGCVDEKHCGERRSVLSTDIKRVETAILNNTVELKMAFGKLDDKFDKYILNNKQKKE